MLRQQANQLADVMDKAHVEHSICFVQNKSFQPIKDHHFLLVEVKQTARSGNKDINAILKTSNLWVDLDAAKHHIAAQGQVSAVSPYVLKHLCG